MYKIYLLIDPRDESPRYVGMTQAPQRRLMGHLRGENNPANAKEIWIQELRAQGLAPIMQEVDQAETEAEARERETYWMRELIERGVLLTNSSGVSIARDRQTVYLLPEHRRWIRHWIADSNEEISDVINAALTFYREQMGE
jgi:hypothetical protein